MTLGLVFTSRRLGYPIDRAVLDIDVWVSSLGEFGDAFGHGQAATSRRWQGLGAADAAGLDPGCSMRVGGGELPLHARPGRLGPALALGLGALRLGDRPGSRPPGTVHSP